MKDLALCNAAASRTTGFINQVVVQDSCAMSPGQQPGPRAPYSYGGHPGDDPRFGPRSDDPRYGPRSDDRWASGRQYTQDGHDRWKTALLAYMLKGLSAVCHELGICSLDITCADP